MAPSSPILSTKIRQSPRDWQSNWQSELFLTHGQRQANIARSARILADAGDIRGGVEVWNSGFDVREFQADFNTSGNLQLRVGVADLAYDYRGKVQAIWNAA